MLWLIDASDVQESAAAPTKTNATRKLRTIYGVHEHALKSGRHGSMSFTRADYPPLSTIAYVSTLTGVTFKPTDITGCQLWLDGADPAGTGVVPSNGTVLTSWIDKSGNAKNATGVNSPTVVT